MKEKIDDKVFGRLKGKILTESLVLGESVFDLSFDFKSEDSVHRFRTTDRRVITKLCQLYNLSYKSMLRDLRQSGMRGTELKIEAEAKIKKNIKKNERILVLLLDRDVKLVSVVSEQHKQLPLSKAFEIVDKIAKKNKAVFIVKRETSDSYVIEYEVNKNRDMSIRVSAYLGRNDALGRAGIRFIGGGNIFICSNAIIPYVDRDITYSGKELLNVKIVHTINVEQRLKNQLMKSFEYAKKNANLLSVKLKESKSIKMTRQLQNHCVELIRIKHDLPDKWNTLIKRRLEEETETLYGLTQALTYVGSHLTKQDTDISTTLQKLGGQIVILGKDFTKLIKKSIQKKGFEVPKLQSSS